MARVSWQRRLEEEKLLQRILERTEWRILQYSKDLTVESGAAVLSEWICGSDAWLVLDLLGWILEGLGCLGLLWFSSEHGRASFGCVVCLL